MRKLVLVNAVAALLAAVIALPPAFSIAAERQPHHAHKKSATSVAPEKKNPCAAYGAGFAPIAGTSTCMKIGGSVSYEAGGSLRR